MLNNLTADGITWLTGQSIDSLLDSCGVVAAAAGPRTVLINSRLAALPASQREWILAEELRCMPEPYVPNSGRKGAA